MSSSIFWQNFTFLSLTRCEIQGGANPLRSDVAQKSPVQIGLNNVETGRENQFVYQNEFLRFFSTFYRKFDALSVLSNGHSVSVRQFSSQPENYKKCSKCYKKSRNWQKNYFTVQKFTFHFFWQFLLDFIHLTLTSYASLDRYFKLRYAVFQKFVKNIIFCHRRFKSSETGRKIHRESNGYFFRIFGAILRKLFPVMCTPVS